MPPDIHNLDSDGKWQQEQLDFFVNFIKMIIHDPVKKPREIPFKI